MYYMLGWFCLIAAGIFAYLGGHVDVGAFCGGMATSFFICGLANA